MRWRLCLLLQQLLLGLGLGLRLLKIFVSVMRLYLIPQLGLGSLWVEIVLLALFGNLT